MQRASYPSWAHVRVAIVMFVICGLHFVNGQTIDEILQLASPGLMEMDGGISDITELDIKLPEEEIDQPQWKRIKRGAASIRYTGQRWTDNTVPYEITGAFDAAVIAMITEAMAEWSSVTCLQFVKRTNETRYVNIKNSWRCWSYIGMLHTTHPIGQELGLDRRCTTKATVIHELGHAIGLYHEHTRPDRDDFVTVNMTNVLPTNSHWLEKTAKYLVSYYGTPYDYRSIMHYGRYYRSIEPGVKDTIVPKDASFLDIIGTSTTRTFLDAKIVNIMYSCNATCSNKLLCNDATKYQGSDCGCYCQGATATDIVKCETTPVWPEGTYSIMKTTESCPAGFEFGEIVFNNETSNKNSWSAVNWPGILNRDAIGQQFCTKTISSAADPVWGAGTYCIGRFNGSCPNGFTSKYMQWEVEGSAGDADNITGTCPDNSLQSKRQIEYCCRNDGSTTSAITLSSDVSFYLMPYLGNDCQEVINMTSSMEHICFDTGNNIAFACGSGGKMCIFYCFYMATPAEVQWPKGTYSIMKTTESCPVGFAFGEIVINTEDTSNKNMWNAPDWPGDLNMREIAQQFCTKNETSEVEPPWPPGTYCIARYGGECPPGFTPEYIQWDEEDGGPAGRITGTCPDNSDPFDAYGRRIEYCCRNDGDIATPIDLPWSSSFYMLPFNASDCQTIKHMAWALERVCYDTEDDRDGNTIGSTGVSRLPMCINYCFYDFGAPTI